MLAAVALVIVLSVLAVFQIALASGAPLGRFAYGGQHERRLPTRLRVSSAVAVLVYATVTVIALDRAGVVDVLPPAVSQVGMWVIFGLLVVATVPNAISRSRPERYVMTPITLVLAVLALITALSPKV